MTIVIAQAAVMRFRGRSESLGFRRRIQCRQFRASTRTETRLVKTARSSGESRSEAGINRDGYLRWSTSSDPGVAKRAREEKQVSPLASFQWVPGRKQRWLTGGR